MSFRARVVSAHKIQIDTFVASHTAAENDNTKIALVARQWAAIAEETKCAVELVHHVRKLGNGATVLTVEDARGASALIAAVRSARVINAMQKEQAEHAGVEDRERYFSVIRGKANLAPRDDKTIWRRIVSVPLGNGPSPGLDDFVGVVEEWCWPDSFADVTVDKARDVQRRLSQGEWRADPRSTKWAGKAVAEVLDLDLEEPSARASVKSMLKTWIAIGALRKVTHADAQRKLREFVEPGAPL
jgi:hypothetical protein